MNKTKVSLEKYTTEFNCETLRNGGWNERDVNLSALLRMASAAEGIKNELGISNHLLRGANWCSFRRAVEKMANQGITVRHEHSLTLKLHWSIHWPWQQKIQRRQRTWRLFKRKTKP